MGDDLTFGADEIAFYSPSQIALAGAIGGPAAAGWLYASNASLLHWPVHQWMQTMFLCTVFPVLVVLLLLEFGLQGLLAVYLGGSGGLAITAAPQQHRAWREHVREGGAQATHGQVVRFALAVLPFSLLVVVAVLALR